MAKFDQTYPTDLKYTEWQLINEDELFLVIKGTLVIKLRDQELTIHEGEFVIIPKGVEHLPVAENEVQALLLEPKSTLNTGDVQNEKTVDAEWI